MARSLVATTSSVMSIASDLDDEFRFLAFNQRSGALLSHGNRAVYALAWADWREPHQAIYILHAGVAGQDLWRNQTPLALARQVIEMLEVSMDPQPAQRLEATSHRLN